MYAHSRRRLSRLTPIWGTFPTSSFLLCSLVLFYSLLHPRLRLRLSMEQNRRKKDFKFKRFSPFGGILHLGRSLGRRRNRFLFPSSYIAIVNRLWEEGGFPPNWITYIIVWVRILSFFPSFPFRLQSSSILSAFHGSLMLASSHIYISLPRLSLMHKMNAERKRKRAQISTWRKGFGFKPRSFVDSGKRKRNLLSSTKSKKPSSQFSIFIPLDCGGGREKEGKQVRIKRHAAAYLNERDFSEKKSSFLATTIVSGLAGWVGGFHREKGVLI